MKRVFLIVLDSFGIGELPDAAEYGDLTTNTLRSVARSEFFDMPNVKKLGFFEIDGIDLYEKGTEYEGRICRMKEASKGRDTTIGHWETAGLVSKKPLPTYPEGFPDEVIQAFEEKTGRKVLCNKPYSGTKVIADYGEEHMRTGALIVYTSADSVFQIAAHEEVVPVEQLYEYCRIARELCRENMVWGVLLPDRLSGYRGHLSVHRADMISRFARHRILCWTLSGTEEWMFLLSVKLMIFLRERELRSTYIQVPTKTEWIKCPPGWNVISTVSVL